MLDTIKIGLLTWTTLFLMIFVFVIFALWSVCSIWWLITNCMLDRNMFILISFSSSLILSSVIILLGVISEEK